MSRRVVKLDLASFATRSAAAPPMTTRRSRLLRRIMRLERLHLRVANDHPWSILRVCFVVAILSFAAGMVGMPLGWSGPWYHVFLLAFALGVAQFAIQWTLSTLVALLCRRWAAVVMGIFLSGVLWFFLFLTVAAFPLRVGPGAPP